MLSLKQSALSLRSLTFLGSINAFATVQEQLWYVLPAHGWQLTVTNELGQTLKAWIDWPGRIWVPALNEGAFYSPDGFTIQFNGGTVWVLVEPGP
jgi:hypothetical protein